MSERPILFSGEMVRAILEGRKTQTRRVMKVQPWPDATVKVGPYHPHWIDRNGESQPGPATFGAVWDHQDIVNGGDAGLRCPYGQPGDLLWVRETWGHTGTGVWSVGQVYYAQDGGIIYRADHPNAAGSWFSPLHMPRWASRITLRITDIRVERLQDITEDDAIAEGVALERYVPVSDSAGKHSSGEAESTDPVEEYRDLWNKIKGPGAWEANPWVWVVAFERVKP
jgi:hypothetical protein